MFTFSKLYPVKTDYYGEPVRDMLNLSLASLPSDTPATRIHTVLQEEEGDPFLVAANEYGAENVDAWTVLMSLNGIVDPMTELKKGDELRVPPLNEIESQLRREPSRVGPGPGSQRIVFSRKKA